MTEFYTKTIYFSDSLQKVKKNNYCSIIANNPIPESTLVLLENSLTGSINYCIDVVQHNSYLFNELHPRILDWKRLREVSTKEEMRNFAMQKVKVNSFKFSEENITLGTTISSINHSCTPNSVCVLVKSFDLQNIVVNFLAIISLRNISAGEEITICYGNNRGHNNEDDFACGCDKTTAERKILAKNFTYNENSQNVDLADAYIQKYIQSKNCIINQVYAHYGFIMVDNENCYTTPDFINQTILLFGESNNEEDFDSKKNKMIEFINQTLNKR